MATDVGSAQENASRREGPSAGVRVLVALGTGVLSAAIVAIIGGPWWLIPLSDWDVAALVLVGWLWRSLWSLDAAETANQGQT